MEIKNSLDWPAAETELKQAILKIKDQRKQLEAKKVLRNFDAMISKLSILELEQRRSHSGSPRKVNEQLDFINAEVLHLNQWITLLLLG